MIENSVNTADAKQVKRGFGIRRRVNESRKLTLGIMIGAAVLSAAISIILFFGTDSIIPFFYFIPVGIFTFVLLMMLFTFIMMRYEKSQNE